MCDPILGLFTLTGGVFWILASAWFVGWAADKLGISK